jgi:hypothetical protein
LARSREKTLQFPGGGEEERMGINSKKEESWVLPVYLAWPYMVLQSRGVFGRGGPQKLRREGHYPVQNGLDAELFYPPASFLTEKITAGLNPSERN